MSIINRPAKTRNLSFTQFFEVLQEEYLICELRVAIYPNQKDKDIWKSIMAKKKEKILDISSKNELPSIFDFEQIKKEFSKRVIPEFGKPKFFYKDDCQRLIQEKWDLHNYYSIGSKVKFVSNTEVVTEAVITSIDFNNNIAGILISNSNTKELISLDFISRLL